MTGQYTLPTLSYQEGRLLMDANALAQDVQSLRTIPQAVRARGPFDPAAFERALALVVARHDALRTSFPDGATSQTVHAEAVVPFAVTDLRAEPDPAATARDRLVAGAYTPFGAGEFPRVRASALRLGEEDWLVSVVLDHLTVDAWSRGIVLRELSEAYAALRAGDEPALPPVELGYERHVREHHELLAGPERERLLSFWRHTLDGVGAIPALAAPTPAHPGKAECGHARAQLSPDVLAAARLLAARERSTLFMVVLCGLQLALARTTGVTDQAVAVNVYNRDSMGTESLVAPMAELMVVRADLGATTTFRQALRLVREASLDAQDHAALPYGELVKELNPADYAQPDVPIGVVLNMQYPELLDDALRLAGAECADHQVINEGFRPRSQLVVVGRPGADGLVFGVRYQADRLDAAFVADVLANLTEILTAATTEVPV